MPRKPNSRPWLHAASGFWCATLNGKRVCLDRDARIAERRLRQLRTDQKRNNGDLRGWLEAPFAELSDEFLTDLKARRKSATCEQVRYGLLRALRILGTPMLSGFPRSRDHPIGLRLENRLQGNLDRLAELAGRGNAEGRRR